MKRLLIPLALALCALVAVPAAAEQGKGKKMGQAKAPDVIQLPVGFQPEGIATGRGASFYVGSIPTGDIYKGSLRTGEGDILVDAPAGRSATGIKVDRRNRLFVSGARTGQAYVYDARTGDQLAFYQLFPTVERGDTFVNDVVVTRRAAYFTDSVNKQLYVLDFGRRGALPATARTLPLTGDLQYDANRATFELNGIAATRNGKRLIAVQSRTGQLFTIDPNTGATEQIDLVGVENDALTAGDGLLLRGKNLYVVQNERNRVAVLRVSRDLSTATQRRLITDSDFRVPTTIASWGHRLYVVNAKFSTPPDQAPSTPYEVVKVPKR
jgi:sugar lactone lactonase YvrE